MTKSSDEAEQLFHLVFPGHIIPGSDHDDVVFKLSRLLKTSPYRANKLVSGKRRYVKRAFFREQAEKLHSQILKLGVECTLETVDDVSSSQLKRKLHKHKVDPHQDEFPDPESHEMQLAHAEQDDSESMSYSETMAELQLLADGLNEEDTQDEEIDIAELPTSTEHSLDEKIPDAGGASTRIKVIVILVMLLLMYGVYWLVK